MNCKPFLQLSSKISDFDFIKTNSMENLTSVRNNESFKYAAFELLDVYYLICLICVI